MKLKQCISLARACGLATYGEAIDNIALHAQSLFVYEKMNEEWNELITEFNNSGLQWSAPLPAPELPGTHWSVALWPDGTWAWRNDIANMTHMSDDYMKLAIPEWWDADDVEMLASTAAKLGWGPRLITQAILYDIDGPCAELLPDNWQPPQYL